MKEPEPVTFMDGADRLPMGGCPLNGCQCPACVNARRVIERQQRASDREAWMLLWGMVAAMLVIVAASIFLIHLGAGAASEAAKEAAPK